MTPSLRIAVADDEPEMWEYFREILPRFGHHVVAVASNGRELVEQCRATKPDLVISDINMPEMDGVTAAAMLCRERPVPVIFVSANEDPDLGMCADLGVVVGHVDKPLKLAELRPMITKAFFRVEANCAVV